MSRIAKQLLELKEAQNYLNSVRGNSSCSIATESAAQSRLDSLRSLLDFTAVVDHLQTLQKATNAAAELRAVEKDSSLGDAAEKRAVLDKALAKVKAADD